MMKIFAALIIGILLLTTPAQTFYVAPYGAAGNTGEPDSPRTLTWAMQSAPSGSTVWLVPGTYAGSWTATAPGVTYRSEVGTRARLDGNLTINAADTTWRDLEVTNTSWVTRTGTTLPQTSTALSVFAPRVKILNSWIHDLAGGIYAFNGPGGASADLVARGNLIYNNGWQDTSNPRSAHGHGVYTQNDGAGSKLFQGNVLLNNYALGIQAYGSSNPSAALDHLSFIGNIAANNSFLIGGGRPLRDTHVLSNTLWYGGIGLGYTSQSNEDVEARGNVIGNGRLQVLYVQRPTVTGNTVTSYNSESVSYLPYAGVITPTWDFNTYFLTTGPVAFDIPGEGFRSLANWRIRTGFDANSTATQGHAPDRVLVQVNQDDAQRRTIVIENWSGASSIAVSLQGLTPGASYRLVNAENPAQVLTFVAGSPISVPTAGWTVATPYGALAPFKPSTAPAFLVFLVEPA